MGFLNLHSPAEQLPESAQPANTLGALMFIGYIIIALLLTALICRDLIYTYINLPIKHRNRKNLSLQLQVSTALATLSFSVLTYHMLDFVLESYISWASARGIPFPTKFYGAQGAFGSATDRAPLYPWQFLRTSTLFQNFATAICSPPEHAWWTSQALFLTLFWNIVISFEGKWRKINNLWAYVAIAQVLPVSFAGNLFGLAILLTDTPKSKTEAKIRVPAFGISAGALGAFAALVSLAPWVTQSVWFLSVVAGIRILLFWPFVATNYVPQALSRAISVKELRALKERFLGITVMSLLLGVVLQTIAVWWSGVGLWQILNGLHGDPAISALGYDYLIGILSLFLWTALVDDSLEEAVAEQVRAIKDA